MTKREDLCDAVLRLAWGYILIHVHVNLGPVDVLPDWLGFHFLASALPVLSRDDSSASLLKPLGSVLFFWEFAEWALSLFGIVLDLGILSTIVTVVGLYFHFQLLTNVANVAAWYAFRDWDYILWLRNVRTILATAVALQTVLQWDQMVVLFLGFLFLVTVFWLCLTLFKFKKYLTQVDEAVFARAQNEQ